MNTKPTYDELLKLLEEQNKIIEEQNKIIDEKDKIIDDQKNEIEDLKVKNRDINIKLNEALKLLEEKNIIIINNAREKYYTKSERLKYDNTVLNEAEEKTDIKKGRDIGSKNQNNKINPDNLRVIENNFSDEELKELESKGRLIRFGEDICVKLIKKAAVYEWVKIVTPKYKYKEKDKDEIILQQESNDAFGKAMVTSSVVSEIIDNKMNLGIPLDRQAKYFNSNGIELSSTDLANYMMMASNILISIYNRMIYHLIHNSVNVIHIDETPLMILDEKDRKNSYIFVLTTSFWDKPIYIYDFSITRETTNIEEYLDDYNGYITVDGYGGYDIFKEGGKKELTGVMMCWAHLRRYFVKADPIMFNKKKKKESSAEHVVHLIDKIFKFEEKFKKDKLTIPQIKEKRNSKEYLNKLNEIKEYIDSLNPANKTKLSEAVNYAKNNWHELTTHLEYGGLDITNSICERAVKPFAVARKSFLFSKSVNGAKATGILFSIVQTAKANGLNVEGYLNYIFNNISNKTADELLPWHESIPNNLKTYK